MIVQQQGWYRDLAHDIERLKDSMERNLFQYTISDIHGKPKFAMKRDRDFYMALCEYREALKEGFTV